MKCVKCCMACCESCVRMINKHAYVEIAIWGSSFCRSCCRVLSLFTNHMSYIAIVNGVAYLLCMMIKLLVMALTGLIGYMWLKPKEEEVPQYGAVVLFAVCFSYVIANAFTDTFEMVAEAMMVVFLEDYSANKENMVGPKELKQIMMGSKKAEKSDDGVTEKGNEEVTFHET